MDDAAAIESKKEDEPPDEARVTAWPSRTSSTSWPPARRPTESPRRLVSRQCRQLAGQVARPIEVAFLELGQRSDAPSGHTGGQLSW